MSRFLVSTTLVLVSLLSLFTNNVESLGLTDTITWGGDNSRAGYQNNHNMDPAVVGSPTFGQIFRAVLPGNYNGAKEQIFHQPLVYTAADGVQYVYVATTQNNLYKLDAKTGAIIASRNLHIPFLVADLDGCTDINPLIGVTGTGVIDPETGTWYMISKTYANQQGGNGAQGRPAGRQILHAVSVEDLSERPNFPVDLEGTVARNNPTRIFNGGIHHQRPALLHYGNYIYAGLGSHCVKFNFTGWIMGWDKTTGEFVERFATQGEGVTNQVQGAGVWMSGGGIASDDKGSMFFATGNGYASQLDLVPVNGRNPPTALEEAVVHMTIADDGSLKIVDFFMPWEKKQLDGADDDLGTTPIEILPSQYACGDVKRIGVITGKSGKTYWLNLDDLGGYRNGPNKLDDVLQVYQNENSVYAGAGVYPLEGGYIYINVIQYPTHVFKFNCADGVPSFTKVADSPTKNAYILGVGHGTTTSLNDQPGTGLVWTSDVDNGNLRIYKAVPENGLMTMIKSFNIPATTKFTRPVFGDGRVYMGTTQGYLYGFGSPVNLPINCTSPLEFGTIELNVATPVKTITCTAKTAVSISNVALSGNANFNVTGLPATPLQLANGGTFSFQAYFNPGQVGPLSSDILVTTSGATGYSTSTPITLRGTGQSSAALLQVSPRVLSFSGAVTGADPFGIDQSAILTNLGNSPLTISAVLFSDDGDSGPFSAASVASKGPKSSAFTYSNLPTTIPAQTSVTISINFDTSVSGNFASFVQFTTNGGTKVLSVVGVSGDPPKAVVEFQTQDGTGWIPFDPTKKFSFGNVTENTTKNLRLRITNNGTQDGAALQLTVSKPPFGLPGIIAASNQVDLAEGTRLSPGESLTANLYCSVPKSQWNVDPIPGYAEWTLNVNDLTFGKQVMQFDCLGVAEQSAPYQSNGSGQGRYRYLGCYLENNPGRQLSNQYYGAADNTIANCTNACSKAGAIFCGTQYQRECWGGKNIPNQKVDEINCNFPCSGALLQSCGGNGEGAGSGRSYISLFADIDQYNGNGTIPPSPTSSPVPTAGPTVNPGVGTYGSIGCYTEATTGRALPNGFAMPAGSKNVATCIAGCASKNYLYAGLEYGQECWCGNAFAAGSVPASIADCKTPCVDKASEFCGAGSRLNVYQAGALSSSTTVSVPSTSLDSSSTGSGAISSTTTSSAVAISSTSTTASSASASPSGPSIRGVVGAYSFIGCYTEATTGRALNLKSYTNDSMTLESCSTFCSGYAMFGVEYGRECYCGNTPRDGSVLAANQADCSFLCPGDPTTFCGAGVRLQMYKLTSQVSGSSSIVSSTTSSVAPTSTVESSTIIGATTPLASSSASTTIVSSSTTTTTSLASTTPSAPTAVPTVGAYTLQGCYLESAEKLLGRSLPSGFFPSDTLTPQMCATSCANFLYFGLEYGRECWCGNVLNAAALKTVDTDCRTPCAGDSSSLCGAGNRLNVYLRAAVASSSTTTSTTTTSQAVSLTTTQVQTTSSPIPTTATQAVEVSSSPTTVDPSSSTTTTPAPSSSSTPPAASVSSSTTTTLSATQSGFASSTTSSQGPVYTGPPVTSQGNANFTYYSCVSEPSSGKLFPRQIENNVTMTIDRCLTVCSQYQYAGVEYGRECWCGNTINFAGNAAATPGKNVSDSECSFACPGNSSQFCGAGNRINLYWFDLTKAVSNGAVDLSQYMPPIAP